MPGQQRVLLLPAWQRDQRCPAPILPRDQPCPRCWASSTKLHAARHAWYHLAMWRRRWLFRETGPPGKFCYQLMHFYGSSLHRGLLSPVGSLKSQCGGTAPLCDGLLSGWGSPEARRTWRGSLLFRGPAYPSRSLCASDGADGSDGGKSPEPVPSPVWFLGSEGPMEGSCPVRPWLSGAGCVLHLVFQRLPRQERPSQPFSCSGTASPLQKSER